jgi:cell fate regulator YaaT (PSP1 superfamily)
LNYDSQKGKDFLKSKNEMNNLQNSKISQIDNYIRDFNNTPNNLLEYHRSFINELNQQIIRCVDFIDSLKYQLMFENEDEVKNHLKEQIHSFNYQLKSLKKLNINIIKSYN